MSYLSSSRIGGMLLAYAALVCACDDIFPHPVSALYLAAIVVSCALAVGLGNLWEKKSLRYLSLLIPLVALALAGGWFNVLFWLPGFLYAEITILTGRYRMKHWSASRLFSVVAAVDLLLIVVSLIRRDSNPALYIFAYLSLACLVFTLRQLRMESGKSLQGSLRDALGVVGFFAGAGLVTGILYLLYYFKVFYYLVLGLVHLVGLVFLVFSGSAVGVVKLVNYYPAETTEATETETETLASTEAVSRISNPNDYAGSDTIWLCIISAIVVIIVLVVLVRFLRRFIQSKRGFEYVSEESYGQDGIFEDGAYIPREKHSRGNYHKLRKIYREYLWYLAVHGCHRKQSDTSLEIYNKSMESNGLSKDSPKQAKEARLREIYIQARYNPKEPVSGAVVREAKELLKEIKQN